MTAASKQRKLLRRVGLEIYTTTPGPAVSSDCYRGVQYETLFNRLDSIQGGAKTGPAYLTANILKTP